MGGHGADFVIVDDMQAVPGLGQDGDAGGEAAESWQNEALAGALPPETRGAEGRGPAEGQRGQGMQMPADGGQFSAGVRGIVDEMQGAAGQPGACRRDAAALRRHGAATVVVTGNQLNLKPVVGLPPLLDQIEHDGGLSGGSMEKIATKDNFRSPGPEDDAGQAGEVVGGVAFRNGHSVVAQVGSLSQVQIRQQQHAGFLPKNAALRQ